MAVSSLNKITLRVVRVEMFLKGSLKNYTIRSVSTFGNTKTVVWCSSCVGYQKCGQNSESFRSK